MSVAYTSDPHYLAPIKLIIYVVVIGVASVIGAIVRKARRRDMSKYGFPPQWQQPGPPPGAWGGPGVPPQQYAPPPSQGYGPPYPPQQPYGAAPQGPQAYGQVLPPAPQQGGVPPAYPPYGS